MSTNKLKKRRGGRPVLRVLAGSVLVAAGALGLLWWDLRQPPEPTPAWPAGLTVAWAFYADDLAILREGRALSPLADVFLDFAMPAEARATLLHVPQSRWPWERTEAPGGPILFLRLADTWLILVQPAYFSAPTAQAQPIARLEAAPDSTAPRYCTTPYGIAVSPSLAALRAVVEAPPGPAREVPGLTVLWAGDGGDALTTPSAELTIADTPELDFTARLPWSGKPLPSGRLRPWLPPGAAVAVQAPGPEAFVLLAEWSAQALRSGLGGVFSPPPAMVALFGALEDAAGAGTAPSHLRAAWLGFDTTDVLPWPILAGALNAPDPLGETVASLVRGHPQIPYQWDQVPGTRIPVWGDQVSLCLASFGGYQYAASRESAMHWILSSPGPSGSSFPAALQVQGNWQALAGAVALLGRFVSREGLLRSVDEATFEQRWLPRLLALSDLGTFAAGFDTAPEGYDLNVTGRLAAGALR